MLVTETVLVTEPPPKERGTLTKTRLKQQLLLLLSLPLLLPFLLLLLQRLITMEEVRQVIQQQHEHILRLERQMQETVAGHQREVTRLVEAQANLTEQLARSMPASGGRTVASLIDTRGISRPSSFNSDRKLWPVWSFRLANFLEGALTGSTKALDWSADEADGIDDSRDSDDLDRLRAVMEGMSNDELSKFSKQIYSALAQLTEGESNDIVRNVSTANGLEAWRVLSKEYDPAGSG